MQEDEESIPKDFINEIFDNLQDIPPEIMEIVDEYFLKCYNKHSYERYTILLCCKIEHEVTDEGILRVYR